MRIITAVGVLVVIPAAFWLASQWINFWISRSVGEWMACGMGIPIAFVFACIVWLTWDEEAKTPKP